MEIYSRGDLPRSLSIEGSFHEIDRILDDLPNAAGADFSTLGSPQLTENEATRSKFLRARSILDPRIQSLADIWIDYTKAIDHYIRGRLATQKTHEEVLSALDSANAERGRLMKDPTITEELMSQ